MKIFTAAQLYEADKLTIEKQQLSSEQLMERAAVEIFHWLHHKMQGAQVKIHIICGIGNNGGDGLALARHLWEHGYNIDVQIISYSEKRSEDFLSNLKKLKQRKIWPNFIQEGSEYPIIDAADIVVDAIFGIGLNREPDKWVASFMDHLNNSGAFIVSVDVPSGLFLDRAIKNKNAVVRANYVLSIQAPKLIFFLPQTGIFSEQWDVLDIGMDKAYLTETETDFSLVVKSEVLKGYKTRKRFTHKGTYGHSLIIGGSYGKIGAVILSSKACLSAGSGLVSAFVPQCGYTPLQSAATEIMLFTDTNEEFIRDISYDIQPDVIGIGMGMGTKKETQKAMEALLKEYKGPLVIDADGLNILAENKTMLGKLPAKTVLTPHPGELKRLIGSWKDDFEKLEKAKTFSLKYDCILVLKDAYSITIYENKGYVNSTGNAGMATAGSGDVLTGMITGLIAQGYEPLAAAITGVFLHGMAGDLVAHKKGLEALTAGDMIDAIGQAYWILTEPPKPDPEPDPPEKEKSK
ncbi:MAG: NAD(P)H-hydrate dehydratase [Flavobacteriaceae bacterium]